LEDAGHGLELDWGFAFSVEDPRDRRKHDGVLVSPEMLVGGRQSSDREQ